MDELIKKHLQDILTAIEEVESFFDDALDEPLKET